MTPLLILVLGITLAIVIYQDCKDRAISVWTLPVIFGVALWYAITNPFWEQTFLWFNLGFISIQLIGLTLYFSIKHRQWINITQQYLGWGDIWFFFALSPLFSPVQFVFFFIGSLIVTLLIVFLYNQLVRPIPTIPLAAAFSGTTLIYGFFLYFNHLSSYNDWILLAYFYG